MKLPIIPGATEPLGSKAEQSRKCRPNRSLKNLKSKRKMAALEKLPTELLLNIFFYTLNLDLPRASPIIAGKLSDEHTFIQTIAMAFEPSWEYHYECMHGIATMSGSFPCPGDPVLQVCPSKQVKVADAERLTVCYAPLPLCNTHEVKESGRPMASSGSY